MSNEAILLNPEPECQACDHRFHVGDSAVFVVKYPEYVCDTLCMRCWGTMVVAAGKQLAEDALADATAPETVRESAERILSTVKDL